MKPSAPHRTAAVVGIIATVLALALLGAGWMAYQDALPADSPRAAANERASSQAEEPAEAQYETAFDKKMVTDRVVHDYLGKKTIDVALINGTEDADLAATTRECLDTYLPGHEFAQCYVFDSTAEYEHKNITSQLDLPKDSPAVALAILCYAYMGRQEPGKPANIVDMRDAGDVWKAQGCPGW